MWTRSASERIDVRASRTSSLRISRSGPSNGLTERPASDGFGVCSADTWSLIYSPWSRLSLILSAVRARVSTERRLSVRLLIRHRRAPRWACTQAQARARAGRAHTLEAGTLTMDTSTPLPQTAPTDRPFARGLMPAPMPVQFLDDQGHRVHVFNDDYPEPSSEQLVAAYAAMVIGRRFDIQATALAKQGRLAVYPPSRGQESCQVGSMLALSQDDWTFPTYRDSMALVTRGLDPVEVLTSPHGAAHCGYDPRANRTAPQSTPLATQLIHAVGFASGEKRKGRPTVAMAFVGDPCASRARRARRRGSAAWPRACSVARSGMPWGRSRSGRRRGAPSGSRQDRCRGSPGPWSRGMSGTPSRPATVPASNRSGRPPGRARVGRRRGDPAWPAPRPGCRTGGRRPSRCRRPRAARWTGRGSRH